MTEPTLDYFQVAGHAAILKIFCDTLFTFFLCPDYFPEPGKAVGKVTSLMRVGEEVLLEYQPNNDVATAGTRTIPADTALWVGFPLPQQGQTLAKLLEEGRAYSMQGNQIVAY